MGRQHVLNDDIYTHADRTTTTTTTHPCVHARHIYEKFNSRTPYVRDAYSKGTSKIEMKIHARSLDYDVLYHIVVYVPKNNLVKMSGRV